MKKSIFVVFVVIVLIVGLFFAVKYGNQKKKETQIQELAIPKVFSAQVKMIYDDTEYFCNIHKEEQKIVVEIEKPERLSGITLNITKEEYSLSYMGMEISGDVLPGNISSVVEIVFNIIEKLENMEYTSLQEGEELITLEYSLGNALFSCVYNKTTGIPIEITVSELLKIEFLEFTVG